MIAPLFIAATVVTVAGLALAWHRRHPRPFPVAWTRALDLPVRRWILVPARFVARLELPPGARVLELGPGGGAVTAALLTHPARPEIVALDVQPAMLRKVRDRFAASAPRTPLLAAADGAALPIATASVDCVVLVTVLGEIPDRAGALAECQRVLRPDGMLAVAETLPDPDFLPHGEVVRAARAHGFAPVGQRPVRVGTLVGTWGAYAEYFRRA